MADAALHVNSDPINSYVRFQLKKLPAYEVMLECWEK